MSLEVLQICFKKGLARLEHHLIAYWKQFVHKQPRAVGAQFAVVTVADQPHASALVEEDLALQPGKLAVFKPNLAGRHAANQYCFLAAEFENHISFGPVDKLQLNLVLTRFPRLRLLRKIDCHVAVSIGNNVAIF